MLERKWMGVEGRELLWKNKEVKEAGMFWEST